MPEKNRGLKAVVQTLATSYRQVYEAAFDKRTRVYQEALEMIKGRPEWLAVSENPEIPAEQKELVLQPLAIRAEQEMDLPFGDTVCVRTRATLVQLESEIEAVGSLAGQALRRLMELAAPKEQIERVPVAKLFPTRITTEKDLDEFLEGPKKEAGKDPFPGKQYSPGVSLWLPMTWPFKILPLPSTCFNSMSFSKD